MCQQVSCLVNRSLTGIFTNGTTDAIGSTNGTIGSLAQPMVALAPLAAETVQGLRSPMVPNGKHWRQ